MTQFNINEFEIFEISIELPIEHIAKYFNKLCQKMIDWIFFHSFPIITCSRYGAKSVIHFDRSGSHDSQSKIFVSSFGYCTINIFTIESFLTFKVNQKLTSFRNDSFHKWNANRFQKFFDKFSHIYTSTMSICFHKFENFGFHRMKFANC